MKRTEFRGAVFKRDNHQCVCCSKLAVDAHHILDRSLFEDGGYVLENGASLCESCHWDAEKGLISPKLLWEKLGVKPYLPPNFDTIYDYDKWGKILSPYRKYPSILHLPFSANLINDDKGLRDCAQFENREVVVTEKLDGENTSGYWDGKIHARSLDSANHPTRNWVKQLLSNKLYELPPGYRICGENVYAKHSIEYRNLKSYFYLFSVWNQDICLSWDDTIEWAELLEIETVPLLYRGQWNEKRIQEIYQEYTVSKNDEVEGYVVRNTCSFSYTDFSSNMAKYVRKNHVQTSAHWMNEAIIKNGLT